ncbi:hypothetical protein LguiA_015814 [Lonicera macranthoides]
MVSSEAARTAVGILGNITALTLFLSPVPTFICIKKKRSVEQYSPAPYLATLINCAFWVLYGLPMVHPHSIPVLTINGSGFIIELVYLSLFLIYSERKKRLKLILIMLAEFIFIAVSALLVLTTLAHRPKLRLTIVGSISMLGCSIMYASPLLVMKLVINTKSVEYMPLFLSIASFANGICWTCYALIRFDPYIAAPNGTGALLGLAQLVLYATYYKSTKQQKLELEAKQGNMGSSDGKSKTDNGRISRV